MKGIDKTNFVNLERLEGERSFFFVDTLVFGAIRHKKSESLDSLKNKLHEAIDHLFAKTKWYILGSYPLKSVKKFEKDEVLSRKHA